MSYRFCERLINSLVLAGPLVTDGAIDALRHLSAVNGDVRVENTPLQRLLLPSLAVVSGIVTVANNSNLTALDAPVLATPSDAVNGVIIDDNAKLCFPLDASWSMSNTSMIRFVPGACAALEACPLFKGPDGDCISRCATCGRACFRIQITNPFELEDWASQRPCALVLQNVVLRGLSFRVRYLGWCCACLSTRVRPLLTHLCSFLLSC